MVAKVGLLSSAFWTMVSPPRMNWMRPFPEVGELCVPGVPPTAVGSIVAMPGTATLLRVAVTEAGLRNRQVVPVEDAPPTRPPVNRLLIGGGQPGFTSEG